MGQVGKPALPVYNDIIAVPDNAVPTITILETESVEYSGYMIHPALEPATDNGEPDPEFEIDSVLYNTDEYFPENISSIVQIQKVRGISLAFIQICPVQFNPVTHSIKVYSKIKYRIEFTGSNKSFAKIGTENRPGFIKGLKNYIKNPNSIPDADLFQPKSAGKDYIIITHSNYIEAASELAKWKNQLGYSVEIVSQSSWISTQVKDAIHTMYNDWITHPDFL